MRRYIRTYDLSDSNRTKLDFVLSVYGPGMKEVSLAANAFVAHYNQTHDRPIKGGHGSIACPDPSYHDISLIEDGSKLPDVIGGMGFGEFLGQKFKERFVTRGAFSDVAYPAAPIPLFADVDLIDKTGSYHIFGGSAFDFLIDTRKLEGNPVPCTWEDVLDPRYRDMVVCGFNIDDINEIILLYIYRKFGTDGLVAFADNLAGPVDTLDMMRTSLHQNNRHAIFLLPHFFSHAAPQEDYLVRVWPDDGALLAPYYVLARHAEDMRVQDIIDFFFGERLARALTDKKMFHVYSQGLEKTYEHRRLTWLGWDWLLDRDIIETMHIIDGVVIPRIVKKHPELERHRGHALWNG